MSIDSYFCFCCLSTNDLVNLFNTDSETNYAIMLDNIYQIHFTKEDFEDGSYICEECIRRLKEVKKFKMETMETLNILMNSGLIDLCKRKNNIEVTKVKAELSEDKYKAESIDYYDIARPCNTEQDSVYVSPKPLKQEDPTVTSQDILDQYLRTSSLHGIALKNEKKITVARKRAKETSAVSNGPSYEVAKDLKCPHCCVVMPNVKLYHVHMNEHFPNHICEACGKGFISSKRLKRHQVSHDKGPFTCSDCNLVFTNRNTLDAHRQRKHSSGYPYQCPRCPDRFRTWARRENHARDAHGVRAHVYRCHLCDNTYHLSGNLRGHILRCHMKVQRYKCTACDAGFYKRSELRAHSASHTGLKEFQCEDCAKRYSSKKSLVVHMRLHTDDKRFCCEICGKKFNQKCTLLNHGKVHSRANASAQKTMKTDQAKVLVTQNVTVNFV